MTDELLEQIKSQITKDNAYEVGLLVREAIRRRLGEKIDELIELPKGKTDKDLEFYMDIAEQFGFSDERSVLERYSYETLREVIRVKTNPKKTRKQKEKELEDFLVADTHLALLEPGLTFVSRQEIIETGRLDILARDNSSKEAVVELKMGNYVSRDVFWQLTKYMNEKPDDRAFFVAPRIKPDLYYALRAHAESGRLVFFEVEENDEAYTFRRIDETNLPKNGRKIMVTSKRKRANGDLVTIVATDNEPVKKKKKAEPADWNTYPFYYQMILLHNLVPKSRERYLQPIEVTPDQKRELENLVKTPEVDSWSELYDEDFDCDPKVYKSLDPNKVPKIRYRRHAKLAVKGEIIFSDIAHHTDLLTELLLRYISGYGKPPTIESLGKFNRELTKILLDISHGDSSEMKTLRQYLELIDLECFSHMRNQRLVQGVKSMNRFPKAHLINELINIKIRRAEALEEIDPILAQAYLRYSITSDNAISLMCNQPPPVSYHIAHQRIKGYLARDQELYKSILDNLVARPDEEPQLEKKANEITPDPDELADVSTESTYDPVRQIRNAMVNGHIERFLRYEAWVDALTEDISSGKYTESQVKEFSEALREANLSRRFRHRESRPDMHSLETFSQDVILQYASKGVVPSAEELRRLYESDVGDGGEE